MSNFGLSETDMLRQFDIAKILFFLLGIMMLVLSLSFPVGDMVDATLVYSRNIATILAWFSLALFFTRWININYSYDKVTFEDMKKIAFASLLAAIISAIKVVLSIINVISYLDNNVMFIIYYVGEVVAWGALTLFFTLYYHKTIAHLRD